MEKKDKKVMRKYERKNLNIKRLLASSVLDIRQMADKNENLSADEYFEKVEAFIESVPKVHEVMTNVSKLAENTRALKELEARLGVGERPVDITKDTETLREMENIKNQLMEIGYNKLDFDIDAICLAIKNSNLQLAEKLASEALVKFSELQNGIKGTYTKKKFEKVQTEDETKDKAAKDKEAKDKTKEDEKPILLKEALESLDYEEANRKLRILAVDDVSIVLNTITSVLSPYYEVYALKNSSQLAKMLAQVTPELFLLDIEMSGINGFELVPIIRKFKEHKDTPIIFLTGNASYDNLKDAIALGACDFIKKPVNKERLLEKIAKNIVRKKAY